MMIKSRRRWLGAVSSGLVAAILTGCVQTRPAPPGLISAAPIESAGQVGYSASINDAYQLHPGDVISLAVFREPALSIDKVPVSAEGTIAMPLIGVIKVGGRTAAEITDEVTRKLTGDYLLHPKVTFNVIEYASHLVSVEGGIIKPGVYQFQPGARLSTAIASSGGPTNVAKLRDIAIFRKSPDGMSVAKFDYDAINQGQMMDPVLQPEDRVVVGTSALSQAWQDMLKALPVFAIFTRF